MAAKRKAKPKDEAKEAIATAAPIERYAPPYGNWQAFVDAMVASDKYPLMNAVYRR